MHYSQQGLPPKRGIILVDTSALLPLLPALPDDFLAPDNKASRPSDMLFFLARNGYRVEIPEMVAHECGGFMRDGRSTTKYFDNSGKFERIARPFIKAVTASDANIVIVPPPESDATPAAELVRNIWEIHDSKLADADKSMAIKNLQATKKKGEHYGDIAAFELIRHMQPPDVPVFYLTHDQDAWEQACAANPKIPVNHINASGLYQALYNAGVLPDAGFTGFPFKDIFAHTNEYLRSYGIERDISPYYTRIAQDRSPSNVNSVSTPFRASLGGLREEIEREKTAAEASAGSQDSTGLDNFRKRFGSIGRVNRSPPGAGNQK